MATIANIPPPSELASTGCVHCGLPVPRGRRAEPPAPSFCCAACEMAREMIRASGAERYYELVERFGAAPRPASGTGRKYQELDDATFARDNVRIVAPDRHEIELHVTGLHCAACVWLLERVPTMHEGALDCRVSMPSSRIALSWDPTRTTLAVLARRIDALGYELRPARRAGEGELRRAQARRLLLQLGVAGAICGNIMLMAVSLYAGEATGIEPHMAQLFRWTSLALTIVLLGWPGAVFLRGAIAAIRTRTPHMDLPIAIGLLGGAGAGAVNTLRGTGDVYFDSLAALVFFLLIGRWLQASQQQRAFDAVSGMHALTPATARVLRVGEVAEVPIDAIVPGDHVEVRAGETIPADGTIVQGRTDLDRSILTGESAAVEAGPGAVVHAGVVNVTSPIRVRVDNTGQATRLGRLMRLVERSMRRRAPIELLADRLAGRFVTVVLSLAALTLAGWLALRPEVAVDRTTALLIVTCPCALGLATPLAIAVALARGARRGIFVKGGAVLEALARPGVIVFDKTGTLTTGCCSLVSWYGDEGVRDLVATVEARCEHPVARALRSAGAARDDARTEIEYAAGGGVAATVDGRHLVVGAERFVAQRTGTAPRAELAAEIRRLAANGISPVVIALDGALVAIAGVADALRDETRGVVTELRMAGWRVMLLSGDRDEVVASVAERAGIAREDAIAAASPEEKAGRLRELAERGTAVMVGDGVNDAVALAEATVGIAVHGGAQASLDAADVFLVTPGLDGVRETMLAARRVLATIRLNMTLSLAYNVVCASLAITGLISPLLAAVLMPCSSLTVLLTSRHRRSFDPCPSSSSPSP